MLRWGLSILGVGLFSMLILGSSGGFGSCGPSTGMLPFFLTYMLAIPIGGVLTLIGLIQLAIDRFRHRKEYATTPRITPL
jgi:hypothetical protein